MSYSKEISDWWTFMIGAFIFYCNPKDHRLETCVVVHDGILSTLNFETHFSIVGPNSVVL